MKDAFEVIYALWMFLVLLVKLVIVFIGLFVLPYYIWKHYDDLKTRSAKMADMARKRGMKFEQAFDRRRDKIYRFLRKVGGSRRYALNVISGKSEGYRVTMFEYHYQRYFDCEVWEYHRWIQHYYLSYFVLDLEKDLPGLSISDESTNSKILSRIADAIGRGDIDFESHEFSERYEVRGDDKKFAYDFCNAQMIEYLIDRTIIPIEVEKKALAICYGSQLHESDIEPNLKHLVNLRRLMPDYLFSA